jgi:2-keto-3-deoxy-L-rhamnonate aldolase RhmA
MKPRFPTVALSAALGIAATAALGALIFQAYGQASQTTEDNPGGRTGPGAAVHYSTNFPLATPAGQDSDALQKAPPGAVNQGPLNPKDWKFGPAETPPPDAKIWNPVMIKMMKGEKVTGGTVFWSDSPQTYCAMANAGYDFIWTEMQHSPRSWEDVGHMWAACPHARAVPGVRVPLAEEHAIQQAVDLGALVVVVPTVRSVQQAIFARDMAFFPPLGDRSLGGGQAFSPAFWGKVPGGYRDTINQNLVMIDMIETLPALMEAKQIAAVPGVTAIFAASGDLGNRSGYMRGSPDYERLINIVHDAAISEHKRLCGPLAWLNRPDFTCFQAGTEESAIMRGVADELGPLKDTQPVPEVGPYAQKSKPMPDGQ